MLGVFEAISSLLRRIAGVFEFISNVLAIIWLFFETYGWRLLIGFASGWHFIQRLWLEHERREKVARRAAIATESSRITALDDRRAAFVERIGETHQETIERKRQRDNELRLRRLLELEKKMTGTGRRLGSQA